MEIWLWTCLGLYVQWPSMIFFDRTLLKITWIVNFILSSVILLGRNVLWILPGSHIVIVIGGIWPVSNCYFQLRSENPLIKDWENSHFVMITDLQEEDNLSRKDPWGTQLIGTSHFVNYREVVLFSGGLKMPYCYGNTEMIAMSYKLTFLVRFSSGLKIGNDHYRTIKL